MIDAAGQPPEAIELDEDSPVRDPGDPDPDPGPGRSESSDTDDEYRYR